MKTKTLSVISTLLLAATLAQAQVTSFLYQGRLASDGVAANGLYDLRFTLYDSLIGGSIRGGPLTRAAVPVSNGVFTVSLDFGSAFNAVTSPSLAIEVRPAGTGAYSLLAPRQTVTPSPYAIRAFSADSVTGNISDAQLSANIPRLNSASTIFNGDVTIANPYDLNFGASVRQMINLWNAQYGIGVQANTLYQRSANNFAWYRNGVHDDKQSDPGTGGTNLMLLDWSGHLLVNSGVSLDSANANTGSHYPGLLFGSPSGEAISSKRNPGGNQYGIDFYTGFLPRMSIANNGSIGIGTTNPQSARLDVEGDVRINDNDLFLRGGGDNAHGLGYRSTVGGRGVDGPFLYGYNGGALGVSPDFPTLHWAWDGNVWISNHLETASIHARSGASINTGNGQINFINDLVPGINVTGGSIPGVMRFRNALEIWPSQDGTRAGYLDVRDTSGNANIRLAGNGTATVKVLEITGGADVAEPFPMAEENIEPGSVVVIDEKQAGRLTASRDPYDTRVAGVISGANGVKPGLALRQQGVLDEGQNVALTGRVYVKADATHGAIKPGDLLTTSSTPGHAMRAADAARSHGAILGKAMTSLAEGKGMVLVLVSLQ